MLGLSSVNADATALTEIVASGPSERGVERLTPRVEVATRDVAEGAVWGGEGEEPRFGAGQPANVGLQVIRHYRLLCVE